MTSIYVIYNEHRNRFKIGFSKNPLKRLKTLQTGNDDTIKLYYEREVKHYSKVEAYLKRHYKEYKIQGEWFECPLSFADLDDMIIEADKRFESIRNNPFF